MTLDILRFMAWERAKGELNSMLQTYLDSERAEILQKAINDFIEDVESNAKHE